VTRRARLLRRVSTVLLTLWVLAVVGAFVHRQLRRRPVVAPVELGEVAAGREETPVRVQRGFVYNDVLGVEPNFRVAASEVVEFASGWYELREMNLSMFQGGEVSYALVAGAGRFNPAEKTALARDQVHLSLGRGVAVRADEVVLHGVERRLASRGSVSFAGPGWGGVGGELAVSLAEDLVELRGGVSVSWRGDTQGSALVMLTPRLAYRRQRGLLECPEGIRFLRGGLRIDAPAAEIQLEADTGMLRQVRLTGPVRIDGALDAGGWMEGRAGSTTVEALGGGRMRLAADPAAGTGWVSLRWADRKGAIRELTAWRLVGEGSEGAWEWLEGRSWRAASSWRGNRPGERLRPTG